LSPYTIRPMEHRLHLYYGDGKGKTTAAVGLAVRSLGAGLKVVLVQFDKGFNGDAEHYSERKILRRLPNLRLFAFGKERVLGPESFRFKNELGDYQEAQAALSKARELVAGGDQNLLILDELLTMVSAKLLKKQEVMELAELYDKHRSCELVLTGLKAWSELIKLSDLATEMRKEKHYFDRKEPPKEGIEY
jgi:cob(I)alamin adenosyltransferase